VSAVLDIGFPCMGSDARLLLEPDGVDARAAAAGARAYLDAFDSRLSRFRASSELCRLNADPREAVPVSPLLAAAVGAARWAAEQTGGLVDPTLVGALRAAGYARTRAGVPPASLAEALQGAPARRPARPDPEARWRALEVDAGASVVRRPTGLEVDTGGTSKGLAADALVIRLAAFDRALVDCGGDIAVGGAGLARRPWEVEVAHPLTGERAHVLRLRRGGVASSGLDVRVWRGGDGRFAHHLLDPSTREPAWTGLIGVTALGVSALEAEVLAKAALLSGPDGARRVLRGQGGLLFHEDGGVELAGPLRERLLVRLPARPPTASHSAGHTPPAEGHPPAIPGHTPAPTGHTRARAA
jgi:thiamine biosynthesis lipoprotein